MEDINEIKEFTYKVKFKNGDTFHWIEERPLEEASFGVFSTVEKETIDEKAKNIMSRYLSVCALFGIEEGRLIDRDIEEDEVHAMYDDNDDFKIIEVSVWPTKESDEMLVSVVLTSDELEHDPTDADRGITDPLELLESVVKAYQELYEHETSLDDGVLVNKKLNRAKAQLNAVQYAYKYVQSKGTLPNLPW